MVECGARHIVLTGRHGAPPSADALLAALRSAGAQVVVQTADVADKDALARVFGEIARSMPPIAGIVHAAGILDDGIVLQLTSDRFRSVMAPKLGGAWNLHALTAAMPLDFFVLCSSAASILGSPGQANYTAANACLDALAHYRRRRGLAAHSINWGPWSGVGLAARPDRGGRLALRGMSSISPRQGVEMLGALLGQEIPQVAVMPVDWPTWRQFYPETATSPFFARLDLAAAAAGGATASRPGATLAREDLLAAEPADRLVLLEEYLTDRIARVLGTSALKVDRSRPLIRMGMDSLMAVELKNRVEADLEIVVPVAKLLGGSSARELAAVLLELIAAPRRARPQPSRPRAAADSEPAMSI
jgi:acyl carrier protein